MCVHGKNPQIENYFVRIGHAVGFHSHSGLVFVWTRCRRLFESGFLRRCSQPSECGVSALAPVCMLALVGCAIPAVDESKSNDALEIAVTTQLGVNATFVEGDVVRLLVTLNRRAYVSAVLENARGELQQLYPAIDVAGGTLHAAGVFQSIPAEGQGFPVVGPFGAETVWLVASDRPLPNWLRRRAEEQSILVGTRTEWIADMDAYAATCDCRLARTSVRFTTSAASFSWPP